MYPSDEKYLYTLADVMKREGPEILVYDEEFAGLLEQPGRGDGVLGARPQLVHREAEHVRGTRLVHPLHVQLLHRGLVDQQDRQLRIRMHVQVVEGVDCQALQRRLVDGDHRLVVDLDAHSVSPCRRAPERSAWRSASYFV